MVVFTIWGFESHVVDAGWVGLGLSVYSRTDSEANI